MKKKRYIIVTALLTGLLLYSCGPVSSQNSEETVSPGNTGNRSSAYSKEGFTANVMAPLHITNWPAFENQLSIAKSIGVDAVSVDVWWGDVEGSADQQFDWSYYDTVFQKICAAGLDVVAIMSFHQCGGNVGDDYTSHIPGWIWTEYSALGISEDDMKYRSETGSYCGEYVSLWADDYVLDQYIEFMDAFENQYAYMAGDIDEINLSGGTAGELRYPSYNAHDWGAYPNRGTFQCYGRLAVEDFQNSMQQKYGNISALNAAWGTNISSFSQINVPSNVDYFVANHDYQNSQYGKDFIFWYNNSLKLHGKRLIAGAIDAFDDEFADVELGIKISGVHWMMGDPSTPRIAEISAGLIETSGNFQSSATGYGYKNILSTCLGNGRDVTLHFTCLEMGNGNSYPAYSLAQDLVFWVAAEAAAQGIKIKGENALSGGVESNTGWDYIDNAFQWASYLGLTVLRIGNVTDNTTGRNRMAAFIDKYEDGSSQTDAVTVHYREFGPAASYTLHCWDGISGDYTMSYEGQFNGQHWWKVTISNAPESFKFCFVNSNGQWDGTNRSYTAQAEEVYSTPWNSTVYTSRP